MATPAPIQASRAALHASATLALDSAPRADQRRFLVKKRAASRPASAPSRKGGTPPSPGIQAGDHFPHTRTGSTRPSPGIYAGDPHHSLANGWHRQAPLVSGLCDPTGQNPPRKWGAVCAHSRATKKRRVTDKQSLSVPPGRPCLLLPIIPDAKHARACPCHPAAASGRRFGPASSRRAGRRVRVFRADRRNGAGKSRRAGGRLFSDLGQL